eukprot:7299310-Lingulodinium_polyedra.AAC.1
MRQLRVVGLEARQERLLGALSLQRDVVRWVVAVLRAERVRLLRGIVRGLERASATRCEDN